MDQKVGTELGLLTPDELAQELRVPKSWVYSRSRRDAIPMVRVGKYVRFRKSDVLASLELRSDKPGRD